MILNTSGICLSLPVLTVATLPSRPIFGLSLSAAASCGNSCQSDLKVANHTTTKQQQQQLQHNKLQLKSGHKSSATWELILNLICKILALLMMIYFFIKVL